MKKIVITLTVFALTALGLWALYERYGKRVQRLEGPANEFVDRATSAVHDASQTVGQAGSLASDAVGTAAHRIADAATIAGHDAAADLSSP